MKRKNFLVLLAAGCLFSCQQQDELQETSKEATNFSISIDDALSDAYAPAVICFLPKTASPQEKLSLWLLPVRTIPHSLSAKIAVLGVK